MMMALVKIKHYGRWDENCNWQLEDVKERVIDTDWCVVAGYKYSERYNEYTAMGVNRLTKTVITVVERVGNV